jgi:hypothetical protein
MAKDHCWVYESPATENPLNACNGTTVSVYYTVGLPLQPVGDHEEGGKIMSKTLLERIKRATQGASYDHVYLDLPDEAISDIVASIKKNKVALRFLARH